ncbi:MAG: DciA family protein [Candidatus Moraniibacteriota bacterium]
METLKSFLHKKREESPKLELDEKTVFYLFQKIVRAEYGERGATVIESVYLREGILGLRAANPLWANELWLQRGSLLTRLNKEIGEEIVKDLKIFH